MASKMQSIEKSSKIGGNLEEIQNFDAKIAYDKWKSLGSKTK